MHIFSFAVAEAYVNRLKYLEVLSLPRGALDLKRVVPAHDVKMVATTTTILSNRDLHPAIQNLFLQTANKLDDYGQAFFTRPGGFPAYIERSLPTSAVAERYYAKGPPYLDGYLPQWLASFLDQIWFYLFAAFAVGYPMMKLLPKYRVVYTKFCLDDGYEALNKIDLKLSTCSSAVEYEKLLTEFHELERELENLWIPLGLNADFYNLRNSMEIVRNKSIRVRAAIYPESSVLQPKAELQVSKA